MEHIAFPLLSAYASLIFKMEEPKEMKQGLYRIREGCYLKTKSLFNEPAIIYPVKDPETGKINKRNFLMGGSWITFITICIILLILIFIVWAFKHDTATCLAILKNPCEYCILRGG